MKIWRVEGGEQGSLAGRCHLLLSLVPLAEQRQLVTGKGSPLGTNQAGFIFEIKQRVCVKHSAN